MGTTAILMLSVAGVVFLTVLALAWPWPRPRPVERRARETAVDERDIMFSRRDLVEGTEQFEDYYREHPDRRTRDDAWRRLPGLMSPDARYAHPLAFAAATASFETVEQLHPLVEGPISSPQLSLSPQEASEFFLAWAKKLGALDSGVTELRPEHLYSFGGRRERYGKPVETHHRFAIAFTVEMDHRMMCSAPDAPTLMESAQQYVSAGVIAVQLAAALRRLGYGARAHIDANYQLICPLVARDAGLGEIGRMGLLMTPRQGPRVRIGVVTTDLDLAISARRADPSVEEFCRLCRKCATACPSQAISHDDAKEKGGVRRWVIDAEACFSLWCEAGTDCGRCVIVCPYAHQENFFHNAVRWGIRRSPLFRRIAVRGDDWLYGRRPPRAPLPAWISARGRKD